MSLTPEKIVSSWERQMQKGYLKLATLFTLTRGAMHGYRMMGRIKELTLGMIKPTAGGLYPALKELEEEGLVRGEWEQEDRRKVYHITKKGREVFREAVEKHFELVSFTRGWILKGLSELKIIREVKQPLDMTPEIRVLLLDKKASVKEKIEALKT
ncbi:MAG: helix-turn-helix transcriptional regulator, partial [Nitrososphaerales archaeon]|nr:helix-turn-helix transcriptional regulator [Nitrososphaerales archaeon]